MSTFEDDTQIGSSFAFSNVDSPRSPLTSKSSGIPDSPKNISTFGILVQFRATYVAIEQASKGSPSICNTKRSTQMFQQNFPDIMHNSFMLKVFEFTMKLCNCWAIWEPYSRSFRSSSFKLQDGENSIPRSNNPLSGNAADGSDTSTYRKSKMNKWIQSNYSSRSSGDD